MSAPEHSGTCLRIPEWLRVKLPSGRSFLATERLVEGMGLRTVCRDAKCPNIFECYSNRTATFLILGGICTRNCSFCNIGFGAEHCPAPLDPGEPDRVAEAAATLDLAHVVVTSVARDDLADGGAGHFAATVRALRDRLPNTTVEVLIPDFQGDPVCLETVLEAAPDVVNHNLETVARLYPDIRPMAVYQRSLELLRRINEAGMTAKSGIMVGLGENDQEILQTIDDLAAVSCGIVTVGQYMRPSRQHPQVQRYVPPEDFEVYATHGREQGIPHMFCAPLVRSSYHAALFVEGEGKEKGRPGEPPF
jgi:lipoyl synthase